VIEYYRRPDIRDGIKSGNEMLNLEEVIS